MKTNTKFKVASAILLITARLRAPSHSANDISGFYGTKAIHVPLFLPLITTYKI